MRLVGLESLEDRGRRGLGRLREDCTAGLAGCEEALDEAVTGGIAVDVVGVDVEGQGNDGVAVGLVSMRKVKRKVGLRGWLTFPDTWRPRGSCSCRPG